MNDISALQQVDITDVEPKVILDTIEATRRKKAVLANLCKVNTTLQRTKGRSLVIPQRGNLVAQVVEEGVDITTMTGFSDVVFSAVTVTPSKIGTWFMVTDEQLRATEIDLIDELVKDSGQAIADAEDDLVASALVSTTGKNTVDPGTLTNLTFELLLEARAAVESDKYDPNIVVCSPTRAMDLVKDATDFVSVAEIGREAVVEGAIGKYAGLDVVPSAAVPDNRVVVFDKSAAPWLVVRRDIDVKRQERPEKDAVEFYVFKEEGVAITEPQAYAVITFA